MFRDEIDAYLENYSLPFISACRDKTRWTLPEDAAVVVLWIQTEDYFGDRLPIGLVTEDVPASGQTIYPPPWSDVVTATWSFASEFGDEERYPVLEAILAWLARCWIQIGPELPFRLPVVVYDYSSGDTYSLSNLSRLSPSEYERLFVPTARDRH